MGKIERLLVGLVIGCIVVVSLSRLALAEEEPKPEWQWARTEPDPPPADPDPIYDPADPIIEVNAGKGFYEEGEAGHGPYFTDPMARRTLTSDLWDCDVCYLADDEGNILDTNYELDSSNQRDHTWSLTDPADGKWKDDRNVGKTVDWIAPDALGAYAITADITNADPDDDDPNTPEDEATDDKRNIETVPSHTFYVTVVIDLDASGLGPDEEDKSPGKIMRKNDNDTDVDGNIDLYQSPVPGETDLVEINLDYDAGYASTGAEVRLTWNQDDVSVWEDAGKTTEVEQEDEDKEYKAWEVGVDTVPSSLWVEGTQAGGTVMSLMYYDGDTWYADAVRLTTVNVNVVYDSLAEETNPTPHEEDPGGFICLNDDDDDGEAGVDKEWESPLSAADLDLKAVSLSMTPVLDVGTVTLTKLGHQPTPAGVRVWENSKKKSLVTGPWDLSDPSDKSAFQALVSNGASLEGTATGSGDLKLSYGTVCEDKVKLTILKVELTKSPASWMPKGGSEENTVTFTATISPPGVQGKIKFSLADVSSAQGYCVNKGTNTLPDLKFPTGQTGFVPIAPSGQEATTATEVNSATITVLSRDYGAYGNIRAETVTIGGQPFSCVARVEEGGQIQEYATIPRDEDDNFIADCWTHNSGDWGDDGDTSLNNTHNGDGLTRYDEYRGVDIDNDDKVAAAERLNPTRKDLFVQGQGFGGGFVFAWGNAFNEAQIEVHEFQGTAVQGIDLLSVSAQNEGGNIQKDQDPPITPRFWVFDSVGESTVGSASAYGQPEVHKYGIDHYFNDKPYRDGNTWTAAGTWGGPPNGVLDPLSKVEDANDNGELDAGGDTYDETDGTTKPPEDDGDADLDGDYWVIGAFDKDLNPKDVDNDGKVELGGNEYEKDTVVRYVVTHEMGHAVGINYAEQGGHCNDATCVMYKEANNWSRDGHFCDACRALIQIHNQ